jgi:hypothetical protein
MPGISPAKGLNEPGPCREGHWIEDNREDSRHTFRDRGYTSRMALILWILAVILVVYGIWMIFRGQLLLGIVVIIVGLLVGPGGVSLFT